MNENIELKILKSSFEKKRRENPKFSLRWLASQLDLSPSMLSSIMSGKRSVPPYLLNKICDILDISNTERDQIIGSKLEQAGYSNKNMSRLVADEPDSASVTQAEWRKATALDMKAMTHWFHIAILEMTCTKSYDGTTEQIAERLNLPIDLVGRAFEDLKKAGLLIFFEGKWVKSVHLLEVQTQKSPDFIVRFHIDQMENAKINLTKKRNEDDISKRFISGITFTTSEEQIVKSRLKIINFLHQLSADFSSSSPEKVYHLGIQLFPLEG